MTNMKNSNEKLSRRDILKLAAIVGAGTVIGSTEAQANEIKGSEKSISKKHPLHIAIIGGGMAGTSLAYRLSRAITYPVITLYEPEEKSCWYQPGLTMLGTGLWPAADLAYERGEYVPMHTELRREAVASIDANSRTVTDSSGKSDKYDYIIVASGLHLDFGAIGGLSGKITSMQKMDKIEPWMNDPAIASIYYMHGATRLSLQLDGLVRKAKSAQKDKKLQVYFTQPEITIKSPAAAKSVLMTLIERLEKAAVRDNVEIILVSEDGKLSANSAYDNEYKKLLQKKNVLIKKDKLISIDVDTQSAEFSDEGKVQYDFIHIAPPMKTGSFLSESSLLNENGFINIDEGTLEHKEFPGIFAIGDAAGCSSLKSASAINSQVKVITDTIRKIDEGDKPKSKYDGYGSDTMLCPSDKSALFESWDYKGKPLSPMISLNPLQCHGIYWYSSLYLSKSYMMNGVMKGWA